MRFLRSFVAPLVLLAAGAAQAASSWSFDDATVQVNAKKAPGSKEKFSEASPLPGPVAMGASESVKVLLVAKEGGKGKRPHQAFVVLQDTISGLEAPFPMTVKDNGKAVVDIVRHHHHHHHPLLHLTTFPYTILYLFVTLIHVTMTAS